MTDTRSVLSQSARRISSKPNMLSAAPTMRSIQRRARVPREFRKAPTRAVTAHHHAKEPVKTPATVRRAFGRFSPELGARAAKIAANITIVGGFVSVRTTELPNADFQEPGTSLLGASLGSTWANKLLSPR